MIVSNNLVLFLMYPVLCHSDITNFYWLRMSPTNMLRLCIFLSRSDVPGLPCIILIINGKLIYGIGLIKCRLAVFKDIMVNSHDTDTNIDVVDITILS